MPDTETPHGRIGTVRRRNALSRWFGDRKIRTKIMIVVGVSIAGTLATGMVALIGIANLHTTRNDEIGREMPYLNHLHTAALSAKAAANDERGYLMRGDTAYRNEAFDRQATIARELAAAAATADGAQELTTVQGIQRAVDAWFTAVKSEFSLFERDPKAALTAALGPNRELRKAYEGLLTKEIDRATAELLGGESFADTVQRTRTGMLIVIFMAMAAAIGLTVYVGRMIVSPLGALSSVLRAIADGDLTRDVSIDQRDETGQMAAALRRATGNLRQTVSALTGHARTLTDQSHALAQTSERSARGAQEGAQRADSVAGSAAEMSRTIQTVATGAEEMGASIREIAGSASSAAEVAQRAVTVTATASGVIDQLGTSSNEIGNVINVITSVAEQTNLLALNATIEAARAGEAGKGFAVVASEVKELAQETARATGDIGHRVAAIQSDVAGAVHAIEEITTIVNQINQFQSTIASAAEEQTVTTNEMSRGIGVVAGTGTLVAETIGEVATVVRLTTDDIAEAHRAADSLAAISTDLRRLVDQFTY